MPIKTRSLISLFLALVVMSPVIIMKPEKVSGILLFAAIAWLALFSIMSLFNVQNSFMRFVCLGIVLTVFTDKFFVNYYDHQWVLSKAIVGSLIIAAVAAVVLRFISLYIEKETEARSTAQNKTRQITQNQ